ncbi:MAG: transcriptional regulator [Byssovorax sp.]
MNTLRYLIDLVLGIALPLLVQRWDRRRHPPAIPPRGMLARAVAATIMTPEQRAGAWNSASWAAALYAFGPLSMLGWAWVAHHDLPRWRGRGPGAAIGLSLLVLAAGLAWALLLSGVIVVADELFARAVGLPA